MTPKEIVHGGNNEMTSCSEHTGGSMDIMESQKYCPRPRWIITFLTRKWTVWKDNSKVEMDWKLIWKVCCNGIDFKKGTSHSFRGELQKEGWGESMANTLSKAALDPGRETTQNWKHLWITLHELGASFPDDTPLGNCILIEPICKTHRVITASHRGPYHRF